MEIEYLEWDSIFFEKKIGKVTFGEKDKFTKKDFIQSIQKEDYDLIYIFSINKMLPSDELLNAKIEMMDIMVTMTMPFDKSKYSDKNYQLHTKLSPKNLDSAYQIAEQTSIVSRFYNDPDIGPDKTKALYRKWIDNALNKTFSDGVFIQERNADVMGIHLIKTLNDEHTGVFTLTGVEGNYKRMGIGSLLWEQSFNFWAQESDIKIIRSPFSFQNKESLNFHLKIGFNKITEVKYIYHYRKNTNNDTI